MSKILRISSLFPRLEFISQVCDTAMTRILKEKKMPENQQRNLTRLSQSHLTVHWKLQTTLVSQIIHFYGQSLQTLLINTLHYTL